MQKSSLAMATCQRSMISIRESLAHRVKDNIWFSSSLTAKPGDFVVVDLQIEGETLEAVP